MSEENVNADGADNTGAAETTGADGTALAAAAAGADGADGGDGNEGGDTALSDAGADGGNNDGGQDGQDGGDGSEGNDGGEGDKPKEGEDGVAPEAYEDFTLPEGLEISEGDKVVFSDVAKELSLSQEQAQKLVDMQSRFQQQQMEAAKEVQQGFISEMRAEADKLPKDTLVGANRFVQKYGSDALKQKMGDPSYYIGNDVDIINAFAKAQQAVDGGFVDGEAAGAEVSAAKTLYG